MEDCLRDPGLFPGGAEEQRLVVKVGQLAPLVFRLRARRLRGLEVLSLRETGPESSPVEPTEVGTAVKE